MVKKVSCLWISPVLVPPHLFPPPLVRPEIAAARATNIASNLELHLLSSPHMRAPCKQTGMLDKLFISKQVIANTGLYLSWKHKQLASELFTLPRATTDSAFSLLASINKFLNSLDGSLTHNTQCFGWHNRVWGQKFLNSPHRPNFEASTLFFALERIFLLWSLVMDMFAI